MSNPLLDLMVQGESGAAGYNAYNRGTYVDAAGGKHIRGPAGAIDFSTLTVGQVHDRQHLRGDDPDRLFAIGKYQIIPATMNDAIEKLHLDRNQPFTPAMQDKIFSDYLITDKRPDVRNFITDKPGATLQAAQSGLAAEWASFGDPNNGGRSHYPPPNVASITLSQSADALNHMRTQYQADIAKGKSPDAAWKEVTDAGPSKVQAPSAQHTAAHANAVTHDVSKQGDHDTTVNTLQQNLGKLGYTEAHGHALKADGDFGPNTKHAVEAFQNDHHLAVDGVAGPKTLSAIQHQIQANKVVGLDNPANPDHALYVQAQKAVHDLDTRQGRTSDQQSNNLAAALTVAAKHEGLSRIDQVALSEDGSRAFAVQNGAFKQTAQVPTAEAVHTSVAQSSQALHQPTAQQQPPTQASPPQVPQQTTPNISI
jgi:peptidoglycan hydrolase-like protein with peptidoglycan-binding domain